MPPPRKRRDWALHGFEAARNHAPAGAVAADVEHPLTSRLRTKAGRDREEWNVMWRAEKSGGSRPEYDEYGAPITSQSGGRKAKEVWKPGAPDWRLATKQFHVLWRDRPEQQY